MTKCMVIEPETFGGRQRAAVFAESLMRECRDIRSIQVDDPDAVKPIHKMVDAARQLLGRISEDISSIETESKIIRDLCDKGKA